MSSFDCAERERRRLLRYEERGIHSTNPPPFIRKIASGRRDAVLRWIDSELSAARAKSAAATTPAGKTRGYSKLLEGTHAIYAEVGHAEEMKAAEIKVRREMDCVRLKVEIDRVGKLACRGRKKRACDAYLDALYLLRGDSTPDEEQQAGIDPIEAKITELGGEVLPSD